MLQGKVRLQPPSRQGPCAHSPSRSAFSVSCRQCGKGYNSQLQAFVTQSVPFALPRALSIVKSWHLEGALPFFFFFW